MQEYTFNLEVNQVIVDGVLNGYKSYIHERNEKQRTMLISDAYAWVKGNHIDDQTARECESVGIEYKKAKAGYTWGYLQFADPENKSMFIVKNARYFNEENFPGGKGVNGKKKRKTNDENYLKKLSRINRDINFPEDSDLFTGEEGSVEILSIFDDNTLKALEDTDVSKLQKEYDKFYIVTYDIDEAFMISQILVWMPNPNDEKAYLVDDLTELINNSSVDFDDVDITVLENDELEYDYDSPAAVDFDIYHEEELDRERTKNDENNSKS